MTMSSRSVPNDTPFVRVRDGDMPLRFDEGRLSLSWSKTLNRPPCNVNMYFQRCIFRRVASR